MPTSTIRIEELQLLELAAKARVLGCKKAYLQIGDQKLKKLSQRWCCLYQNMVFYFESESVTRPVGVVFLEGTTCRPVDQIGLPIRNTEGAFCISSEWSNNRMHFFVARNDKERDSWIESLSNANMGKLQRDLEEQREVCVKLRSKLSTNKSEVEHLTQANLQALEDIQHLRGALQCVSPARKRPSVGLLVPPSPEKVGNSEDDHARVLQGYIRGWLIRRRWKKVVREYLDSPQATILKKRNQLIWKFVASEEDYVSQLKVLSEEYLPQCEIASGSRKPPLCKEQVKDIFRNCEELLLFHQLFLRGLHSRVDKWPVVVFGDVLKLFVPMLAIYHQFVGNHTHALDVLLTLTTTPLFKSFIDMIQSRPQFGGVSLNSILVAPLKRISTYIQDLQELRAHTPTEHVDYGIISDTIKELEFIQKTVTDEVTQSENIRRVLKIENLIEGGCVQLLDKEQTLIRQGILQVVRTEDRLSSSITSSLSLSRGAKLKTQSRYCFLFSKHLLITVRVQKKPKDCYKVSKVIPLRQCRVLECRTSDIPEVHYRGMKVECIVDGEVDTLTLVAGSVNEKAQWMADYSQCIENEKQNKIIQSQSAGEPVELDSKFIRYSTLRTGKEQLVNCGNIDSLLERLVKVSYFGLDFLNTFLMTFDLYTNAHTVLDYLDKSYREILHERERQRSGSVSPHDAILNIRASGSHDTISPRSLTVVNGEGSPSRVNFTYPRRNGLGMSSPAQLSPVMGRTPSATALEVNRTITGIFFALKHWISKHFHHFTEDQKLAMKLELLIEHACKSNGLNLKEKEAALDVSRMYMMQKGSSDETSPIIELMNPQSPIHLPQKPFECLLLWSPRESAEQLCIVEATLFGRIENSEILRYFQAKGEQKAKLAPHLHTIFEHFNRMNLFFMWSVAKQRYFVDRTKTIEFLIQMAWECYQLNNFSSLLQLMSALEHGSVQKYKSAWEYVAKNFKQQFRSLKRVCSTDGRFKELRLAMKKAQPPMIPYLGIVLSELTGLVEVQPTVIEDNLVNFSKMRRCTRLITETLQYQKDPYEFSFIPEISKVLLCTEIPGNDDDLYQVAQVTEDRDNLSGQASMN